MKIKIIAVGRVREKYIQDGIKEFSKRLSRYAVLESIELKDEKAPEKLSPKEMDIVKNKEGTRILEKIPPSAYVIALDIRGKELSSEALSKKIEDIGLGGHNEICFIIGGSLGLSKKVLKRSNYKLSFSKMTFPHQLMRLILLEQVYRGFKIMRNEPYHK